MRINTKFGFIVILFLLLAFPIETYGESEKPEDISEELHLLIQGEKGDTLSKNDVENVVKKWDENTLTKQELSEQIIEMKDDRIKLLEGNITWILAIASILLVLFGAAFTTISFLWRNSIIKEFDQRIGEINTVSNNVDNDRKIVEREAVKISDTLQELKQVKRDLDENQRLLLDSRKIFNEEKENIESYWMYSKFMDHRIECIEAIKKYNFLKIEAKNICDSILDYIEGNKIINEPHVLQRISKKNLMYDEGDKVSDIFRHYYNGLKEEEDNIIGGAQEDLSWEDYIIATEHGEEEIHSLLIDDFNDWKDYLNSLKVILDCIEVEISLNSK
ncbi:hypothetical protein CQ056_28410 [Peribacillus simplex]|uniref:hypothetical protein n=1 Tax=Peribacillus TaxID=2675229 RepID=UPI000CFF4110|nr:MULTISPECIES: hypothetical protein [Peribacillus]MCF7625530.1 hypothetical protein [Peribacillus frigoritolerans]PRA73208.1 hypothetical protein CQ056_28410 [Peribacillus simplex]